MPVYHTYKLIFIHIPKTAGTSVQRALESVSPDVEWNGGGLWEALLGHPRTHEMLRTYRQFFPFQPLAQVAHQHLPARMLREFVSPAVWEDYHKFAVVRNPWETVVSEYFFLREMAAKEDGFLERAHPDLTYLVRRSKTLDEWLQFLDWNEVDFSSYVCDAEGNVLVDEILRYEDLTDGFGRLCANAGVSVDLPTLNASVHADYRSYYSTQGREIVARNYARDIERFGYEF